MPRVLLFAAATALVFSVAAAGAAAGPDPPAGVIVIDRIAARYAPVSFDHELHDSYASCVECHHHVTGAPPSDPVCLSCHRQGIVLAAVGCADCHTPDRFSRPDLGEQHRTKRYHIDRPGLKGAYHLNCINCHLVIGTGPTGCRECHAAREDGPIAVNLNTVPGRMP